MILLLFQSFIFLVVPWVCWRLVRRRLFPTVLDNIPGPRAQSWIAGSLNELVNTQAWDYHQKVAETYGGVTRVKGVFGANSIYVFDPKALHHILVKISEPIFYLIAYKVDIMKWMTRLGLEVMGQAGLGYSFDDLTDNSVLHEYALAAQKLVTMQSSIVVADTLIPLITKIGTPRFRRFVVDLLPFKRISVLRDIVDTLHRTSVGILKSKRQAIHEGEGAVKAQIGGGKDIMSVLMRDNKQASENERWSEEELLGQITSLTFAGTDTTSAALSRTLHLLALHKDVQQKAREEVRKARKEGGGQDISYDVLVSLPYLDAICKETLRLHPPVSTLTRVTRQDVVLPVGTPIKGLHGEQIQEVPLPKGTLIIMSIFNANRTPQIWGPDAQEWKPDRWLRPLPDSVVNAHIPGVYSHLLTFLAGGRACMGFKFAQLEMSKSQCFRAEVVLALLLESLEFSVSDKKIFWQMNGTVTPNLHPNIIGASLPMVISLAK
ncbi:hypothetical protein GALMADRAFT_210825 [Galerina marginata CBS 339.88]|uniref:Cytochrome P450 n=1 Tax=Galerina marginata (strain CBS 339.88) TaxID=685588 RepID=A0A067TAY0_GALM3|nr:hypothetical protein GALMADRAFT_210825 [Galerina marginata CBS 339.88]